MIPVTMFCMRTNAGEGFRQSFVYSRLFSNSRLFTNGGVTHARGMKEKKNPPKTKCVSGAQLAHKRRQVQNTVDGSDEMSMSAVWVTDIVNVTQARVASPWLWWAVTWVRQDVAIAAAAAVTITSSPCSLFPHTNHHSVTQCILSCRVETVSHRVASPQVTALPCVTGLSGAPGGGWCTRWCLRRVNTPPNHTHIHFSNLQLFFHPTLPPPDMVKGCWWHHGRTTRMPSSRRWLPSIVHSK